MRISDWSSDVCSSDLIASSQGDNAYAVFRLPEIEYVGRFAVGAGEYGATSETDGIEAVAGSFGPAYPDGIFLAQDGDTARWRSISSCYAGTGSRRRWGFNTLLTNPRITERRRTNG